MFVEELVGLSFVELRCSYMELMEIVIAKNKHKRCENIERAMSKAVKTLMCLRDSDIMWLPP